MPHKQNKVLQYETIWIDSQGKLLGGLLRVKVVISDYNFPTIDSEKKIIEKEFGAELIDAQCKNKKEFIDLAYDADAVLTQYFPITSQAIKYMNKCKVIVTYGIGTNAIDVGEATKKGIIVSNVPDYGINEVSDHTIAIILNLSRRLSDLDQQIRSGLWGYRNVAPITRLSECVLGLIGFGKIARLVARKAKPLSFKEILVHDPYVSGQQISEYEAVSSDLDNLLQNSDYISLHAPLNEKTRYLIDSEQLKKMKASAYLINVGRGALINEKALIAALEEKQIAGAGLDVFEKEPLSVDSPLLNFKQVIFTPHCAWYSEQALNDLQIMAAEEVVRVLKGEKPRSAVNY